jgi:hypothetical protein
MSRVSQQHVSDHLRRKFEEWNEFIVARKRGSTSGWPNSSRGLSYDSEASESTEVLGSGKHRESGQAYYDCDKH